MNEFQLSIPQRISFIRVVLTLGVVCSIMMSFHLWFGFRSFPHAPIIQLNNSGGNPSLWLTVLLISCLLGSLVLTWQRPLLFVAFVISVTLVMLDANRMQHWFYMYTALLFVVSCYNGRVDDSNKYTSYFILLQLMVASVYFFCGISQLNTYFVEEEYPKLVEPLAPLFSERQFKGLLKIGVLVPYSLVLLGLGLIITPIRFLAISFGVILHVMLLILLFPSVQHQNYPLWFSNLVFLLLLLLLFSGRTKQRYYSPAFLFQVPVFYLVIPLFIVLPFSNSSGFWPNQLSSNLMYSPSQKMTIPIKDEVFNQLPLYQKYFCQETENGYLLDYERWCNHELKVDCNPEPIVVLSVVSHIQKIEASTVKEAQLAAAFD